MLTQGPMVPKFEDCVSKYAGVNHAVATNSATSALHSMSYAKCKEMELFVVNHFLCNFNANCALYCGTGLNFVDMVFNLQHVYLKIRGKN